MKKFLPLALIGSFLFLQACNEGKVETEEQKYSYAIGFQFAQNLKGQNVKVDSKTLAMAVNDVLSGKDPKIPEAEMQKAMQAMYEKRRENMKKEAEENKKKGSDFLAKNKDKGDVKTLESGLQYKVMTEGKGKKPAASDTVKVHYRGTLIDGTEFDSSYKRDKPAEFPVKAVIPGWTEALQLMKTGGKWKLFIPSELAYGERGRPSIPPNSVLIFEVELLEIIDKKADKKKKK